MIDDRRGWLLRRSDEVVGSVGSVQLDCSLVNSQYSLAIQTEHNKVSITLQLVLDREVVCSEYSSPVQLSLLFLQATTGTRAKESFRHSTTDRAIQQTNSRKTLTLFVRLYPLYRSFTETFQFPLKPHRSSPRVTSGIGLRLGSILGWLSSYWASW